MAREEMMLVSIRLPREVVEVYKQFAESTDSTMSEVMREQLIKGKLAYAGANAITGRLEEVKKRMEKNQRKQPMWARAVRYLAGRS